MSYYYLRIAQELRPFKNDTYHVLHEFSKVTVNGAEIVFFILDLLICTRI